MIDKRDDLITVENSGFKIRSDSESLEGLTPMMRQYMEIKNEYPDFILFYRLGDFYEMFFDDAVVASKILGIALTKRNSGSGEKAPLCGVPFHAADQYLAKLIKAGVKVAICDQTEDPKTAVGIVKREVTRLITPGTLTDPDILESASHSYLLSLAHDDEKQALAYVDVSTGLLKLKLFSIDEPAALIDEILIIEPKEILIHSGNPAFSAVSEFSDNVNFECVITEKTRHSSSHKASLKKICDYLKVHSLSGFGVDEDSEASVDALVSILDYVDLTLKRQLPHIDSIIVDQEGKLMKLDAFTLRNLELTEGIRSRDREGSLIAVMDKTKTAMGARLLKMYMLEPLLDIKKINSRLDAVSYLKEELMLRMQLVNLLSEVYDFERLLSKLALGTINPRDMNAFKLSFDVLPSIIQLISGDSEYPDSAVNRIVADFDTLQDLKIEIERAIVDDAPISLRGGAYIKAGYNSELDDLNFIIENSEAIISEIEQDERERTGIKNLKVGYNKVYGYYVEISKGQLSKAPDDYIRRQTLTNAERYIMPRLKELEGQIVGAKEKAQSLEFQLFDELRLLLLQNAARIRKVGSLVAEIDVYAALAELAEKNSYVRPELTNGKNLEILASRHPVVETIISKGEYIPNDCRLSQDACLSMLLTGPNMAGKSTYLRQVALITLMAQMGSFVPCSSCKIGITDRIFTRVGASDDLYRGRSTFMVEMLELASILNYATDRSLLVLDEIGRGTATYDGLSIAWAALEHITKNIKARTLFATHYHELTDLERTVSGVCNYRISVVEKGEKIIFLHKLEQGSISKSFGIHVARLAGVPSAVIRRANQILKTLEAEAELSNVAIPETLELEPEKAFEAEGAGLGAVAKNYGDLVAEIREIDIVNTTPMAALQILQDLIKKVED